MIAGRRSADYKRQGLAGRSFVLVLSIVLLQVIATAQSITYEHMNHMAPVTNGAEIQDWAKQRLAKSPRHQEWVKVKNGNR